MQSRRRALARVRFVVVGVLVVVDPQLDARLHGVVLPGVQAALQHRELYLALELLLELLVRELLHQNDGLLLELAVPSAELLDPVGLPVAVLDDGLRRLAYALAQVEVSEKRAVVLEADVVVLHHRHPFRRFRRCRRRVSAGVRHGAVRDLKRVDVLRAVLELDQVALELGDVHVLVGGRRVGLRRAVHWGC